MDIMSYHNLSLPSIEGYNYALIIADDESIKRGVYALKKRMTLMLLLGNGYAICQHWQDSERDTRCKY